MHITEIEVQPIFIPYQEFNALVLARCATSTWAPTPLTGSRTTWTRSRTPWTPERFDQGWTREDVVVQTGDLNGDGRVDIAQLEEELLHGPQGALPGLRKYAADILDHWGYVDYWVPNNA